MQFRKGKKQFYFIEPLIINTVNIVNIIRKQYIS